ncbi:MAG: glycosyltransferase family 9 protein [Verrucomicrobiota bacterium]
MADKPKLLVMELWGLGDLVIATPFLRAAAEKFAVTLLAKPFALELRPRLWPSIQVITCKAPWTAFRGKYHFWNWPWREMLQLRMRLVSESFECAISARWDPRDHLVLRLSGARERLGFPRLQSQRLLTRSLQRPAAASHHGEFWNIAGRVLGLDLVAGREAHPPHRSPECFALVHSGARLPVRVWPLEKFHDLAARLRDMNVPVQIACDTDQLAWWQSRGEQPVCPRNVTELLALMDRAGIFIGNDSGPGHLAAYFGLPTFTIFGPQLSEWFAPLSATAEVFEGKACPYKPCSDYCRYARPFCLSDVKVEDVWPQVEAFAEKHLAVIRPMLAR